MSNRGGRRPGAGRKSKAEKLLEAGFVCNYFGTLEREKFWKSMLASPDERIRFEAGKYLTDRLYGKPSQAKQMNVTVHESLAKRLAAAKARIVDLPMLEAECIPDGEVYEEDHSESASDPRRRWLS